MKQQLYKILILITIIFSFSSCLLEDEDEISSQDLLLGKWQTIAYTENNIVPNDFTRCDLSRTMEFFDNNITFIEYILESDTESNCVFDETYTFQYEIVNDNTFKIIRTNGQEINVEILELTTSILKVKAIYNNGNTVKKEIFTKIN